MRRSVLFLVENQSVPADRRVWQESVALREAGYDVVVVCPRGDTRDQSLREVIEGIEIHRYRARPGSGSPRSYLVEYGSAIRQLRRLGKRLARERRFDVVHIANPPDLLFLAAAPLKRKGARIIFDHHDLVPELFASRFGAGRTLFAAAVRAAERLTFRAADVVISTNETYRRIALTRGRKEPGDVFVVRNGPDLRSFRPVDPEPALKRGRPHLIVYVGTMGPQDGVEHAVHALSLLHRRRDDWHAIFAGDGEVHSAMQDLAVEHGLGGSIDFPGRVDGRPLLELLSTADVCLAPEPKNPFNDASTLMKIAEYMAMSRAVVAYDLKESRATAGDAALFAAASDPAGFAASIERLLDDAELRKRLGLAARARVERELSWEHAKPALLAAYERVLSGA